MQNYQEVSALIKKYKENNCTVEEQERLYLLLQEKASVKPLLEDMRIVFGQLLTSRAAGDTGEAVSPELRNRLLNGIHSTQPAKIRYIGKRWAWIAAACIILFTVLSIGLMVGNQSASWNTVATRAGEQKRMELPDGTIVILNGNTSLSFLINKEGIRLAKLNGEAFFDVMKDPARPFFVVTDRFTTQVLGTSFNIDSHVDPSVSVQTGLVKVVAVEAANVLPLLTPGKTNLFTALIPKSKAKDPFVNTLQAAALVEASDKAVLSDSSNAWQLFKGVSGYNWTNGELAFIDESAKMVIDKLARYYGTEVQADSSLLQERITISFSRKTEDQVFRTIAALCQARAVKENKTWKLIK